MFSIDPIIRQNRFLVSENLLVYPLKSQILILNDPEKEAFENCVGEGENAGKQNFKQNTVIFLFPRMFFYQFKRSILGALS